MESVNNSSLQVVLSWRVDTASRKLARARAHTHTPKGLRSVTKNLAILCLVSVLLQYAFALTPFAQDRAAEMLCYVYQLGSLTASWCSAVLIYHVRSLICDRHGAGTLSDAVMRTGPAADTYFHFSWTETQAYSAESC